MQEPLFNLDRWVDHPQVSDGGGSPPSAVRLKSGRRGGSLTLHFCPISPQSWTVFLVLVQLQDQQEGSPADAQLKTQGLREERQAWRLPVPGPHSCLAFGGSQSLCFFSHNMGQVPTHLPATSSPPHPTRSEGIHVDASPPEWKGRCHPCLWSIWLTPVNVTGSSLDPLGH